MLKYSEFGVFFNFKWFLLYFIYLNGILMNLFDYIYELCIDLYWIINKGFFLKKLCFIIFSVFLLYWILYELEKKIFIVFLLYECELLGNKYLVNSFF